MFVPDIQLHHCRESSRAQNGRPVLHSSPVDSIPFLESTAKSVEFFFANMWSFFLRTSFDDGIGDFEFWVFPTKKQPDWKHHVTRVWGPHLPLLPCFASASSASSETCAERRRRVESVVLRSASELSQVETSKDSKD